MIISVLDLPLESQKLRDARATVIKYANSLAQQQKHLPNVSEEPLAATLDNNCGGDTVVFHGKSILQNCPTTERPPQQVVEAIENLWLSPEIQQAYQRRNEFQLVDSAAYFLGNVTKFTAEKYVPSDQDILRTRVITTGIVKVID